MHRQTIITRTALLLALILIFQSLRLFVPLPPFFSTFIIGTLVNATLITALYAVGLLPALFLSVIAPLVAYFQQLLLLPVFIVPVAAANSLFVVIFFLLKRHSQVAALVLASGAKALTLFLLFTQLLRWIAVPPQIATGLLFVMSWPQFVTALAGAGLAATISRRLGRM